MLLLLVLCAGFRFSLISQNLVPNSSFEQFDTCPNTNSQLYFATGWHSFGYSPEYFNACDNGIASYGVPTNAAGYQNAATGFAYAGIFSYNKVNGKVEYIGIKLTNSLIIGKKYSVNFKVCLSDNPSVAYANNKLGALFSTLSYSVDSICPQPCNTTLLPPKNFAHVYSNTIITDTANWTTISGSFVADSAYQYIIIGNHFDTANTSIIHIDTTGQYCCGYYLIDDVSVTEDSTAGVNENYLQQAITIYPALTKNSISISFAYFDKAVVKIFNSIGEVIYDEMLLPGDKKIIDISNHSPGIYIVEIKSNTEMFIQKIILTN